MLNPNRLEELGFVYSLNEDNHSDETWTLGENTMKYNRIESEKFGGILTTETCYVYGFELIDVPTIEQIEEFVGYFNLGTL